MMSNLYYTFAPVLAGSGMESVPSEFLAYLVLGIAGMFWGINQALTFFRQIQGWKNGEPSTVPVDIKGKLVTKDELRESEDRTVKRLDKMDRDIERVEEDAKNRGEKVHAQMNEFATVLHHLRGAVEGTQSTLERISDFLMGSGKKP